MAATSKLAAVVARKTGTQQLEMGHEDTISFANHRDSRRRLVRYPGTDSPNAKIVLKSLIPAFTMNCLFYASSGEWV